jgi:hypothetical protein
MSKRSYGDGAIDERGPDTFRLRYRLAGQAIQRDVPRHARRSKKRIAAPGSIDRRR